MSLSPSKWNAAQRERAKPGINNRPTHEYTPGCGGCEDLIAYHQAENARQSA